MDALFEQFDTITRLTTACKDHLQRHLIRRDIADNDFILHSGETCQRIGFVHVGSVRNFVLCNGEKITSRFALPGELCISPFSYFNQERSNEYIQAIEDSIIYEMDYAVMQKTCCIHLDFRILIDTMILKSYLFTEVILNLIHTLTPYQRYQWINKRYQDSSPIRRQYFASYLGLSKDMIAAFSQHDRRRNTN